jgi:hypothetical protein
MILGCIVAFRSLKAEKPLVLYRQLCCSSKLSDIVEVTAVASRPRKQPQRKGCCYSSLFFLLSFLTPRRVAAKLISLSNENRLLCSSSSNSNRNDTKWLTPFHFRPCIFVAENCVLRTIRQRLHS